MQRTTVKTATTWRSVPHSTAWLLAAVLAVAAGLLLPASPAAAEDDPEIVGAACEEGEGVTIVADFTTLASEIHVGCAEGEQETGFAALENAENTDFTHTESEGIPGFVCQINGQPTEGDPYCSEEGFWSYWYVNDDGEWDFMEVGAGDGPLEVDGIYGFAWDGDFATETEPPRIDADELTEPAPAAGVERLAGEHRVDTAVTVSQTSYDDAEANGVVLVRADDFADALAGTPLAAHVDGPLLLSWPEEMDGAVLDEISRVLADDGVVHVLGGEGAIAPAVTDALADAGIDHQRVAGESRFETALQVAEMMEAPEEVLIADGTDFPDALTAGTAAAARGAAVLLTAPDEPHDVTAEYLEGYDAQAWAVGGPAARAFPEAEALVGASRFETATAVASELFDEPDTVGVVRFDDPADALAGGAHAGSLNAPLLLTTPDELHADAAAWTCDAGVDAGWIYGGEGAIGEAVADELAELLEGENCN